MLFESFTAKKSFVKKLKILNKTLDYNKLTIIFNF